MGCSASFGLGSKPTSNEGQKRAAFKEKRAASVSKMTDRGQLPGKDGAVTKLTRSRSVGELSNQMRRTEARTDIPGMEPQQTYTLLRCPSTGLLSKTITPIKAKSVEAKSSDGAKARPKAGSWIAPESKCPKSSERPKVRTKAGSWYAGGSSTTGALRLARIGSATTVDPLAPSSWQVNDDLMVTNLDDDDWLPRGRSHSCLANSAASPKSSNQSTAITRGRSQIFSQGRADPDSAASPKASNQFTAIPNSEHEFERPEKRRAGYRNANKLVKKGPKIEL